MSILLLTSEFVGGIVNLSTTNGVIKMKTYTLYDKKTKNIVLHNVLHYEISQIMDMFPNCYLQENANMKLRYGGK